ncbi:diaminopimelate decarboxylase [Oscillospiraceae bacterium OttesenSCG-928-F05]|nr:diaminopimelate decarboxylase [Oscillospiraceae bacterium OttesenSCG-928-F05]
MKKLNTFGAVTDSTVAEAAEAFGTPVYLYDETLIAERCREVLAMPNAYGIGVRYAMKANSSRALLKIIRKAGLAFDASSLNEVRRAHASGIAYSEIMLTTQEVPLGADRADLEAMIDQGLKYNVCSLRQLELIGDFAAAKGHRLSMRIHPGVGAGESATRNTGDDYSCFGVHLSNLGEALRLAGEKGLIFRCVHVHIGSGGDPAVWRENIDRELEIVEKYFPEAQSVSLGGGLKEARMPDERAADVAALGLYAKARFEDFYARTGRKLTMEIEPGTYIMANAGYIVTRVMDKKQTGGGLNFVLTDGGMETNARPLLYGSRHPFYVVSQAGELLSSDFSEIPGEYRAAVVGRCCESGDAQCLTEDGLSVQRPMAEPNCGDYVVIGGAGAYCASMSLMNYNSHVQAPEVLLAGTGNLRQIRRRQTLEQVMENEMD